MRMSTFLHIYNTQNNDDEVVKNCINTGVIIINKMTNANPLMHLP